MLVIVLALLFNAYAERTPEGSIELQSVKSWAVTASLSCGASLGPGPSFDEKKLTVDHNGFHLSFRRQYGGVRLLFPMLESPGVSIGNEDIYGVQKTAHLESFKSLVRVFREIDPEFSDFHIDAGRGFTYRKNDKDEDPYAAVEWNGFHLDWLNDRLTYPDGETKIIRESATEVLRLLFRANNRPVTFQQVFDQVYPGRRAAVRPLIMQLRTRLMRFFDDSRLRLRVDEDREEITLYSR